MRRESIWNHHSRECAAIASGKESKFGAECSRKGFFGVGQALLDIMHAGDLFGVDIAQSFGDGLNFQTAIADTFTVDFAQ